MRIYISVTNGIWTLVIALNRSFEINFMTICFICCMKSSAK